MSEQPVVALYARVSSDQQAKSGTIESQVAALRERIISDGEQIAEELCFIDAGVSGATLIRPQLERLRDRADLGLLDRLYVLSPDRLSRKYAHQALLMEEFNNCGIEIVFLNHAIGKTPEEELLLQMQGMIAEYERAKIMERNRRGKLHAAKRGSVNILSGAPYGYRYQRKQADGTPAQYVIDLTQASTVRKIFQWVGGERLSIGEVVRRLEQEQITTATGKLHWDRSVVWGMLQNPAYMGRAAFGKTKSCDPLPRVRPTRHSAEIPKKSYSSIRTGRTDWIEIAVPPLISEALYDAAQEQLEENRKLARQHRRGATYLLQGLVVCGHCRYAYYGKKVSKSATKGGQQYAYYRCVGTDAYRFGGERICNNKQVRTSQLDELVWQQVVSLLQQPERLRKEYEYRLQKLEQGHYENFDTTMLEKQNKELQKSKSRLIDSYTDGLIDKSDFEPKITQIKARLEQIKAQIEAQKKQHAGQVELFLVINRLEEFATAIKDRMSSLDFNTKREILRALLKRVEIHHDEIVVIFRVDPDPDVNGGKGHSGSSPRNHPGGEGNTDKIPGASSMQDCTRRNQPVTVEYLPARSARPLVRAGG